MTINSIESMKRSSGEMTKILSSLPVCRTLKNGMRKFRCQEVVWRAQSRDEKESQGLKLSKT